MSAYRLKRPLRQCDALCTLGTRLSSSGHVPCPHCPFRRHHGPPSNLSLDTLVSSCVSLAFQ